MFSIDWVNVLGRVSQLESNLSQFFGSTESICVNWVNLNLSQFELLGKFSGRLSQFESIWVNCLSRFEASLWVDWVNLSELVEPTLNQLLGSIELIWVKLSQLGAIDWVSLRQVLGVDWGNWVCRFEALRVNLNRSKSTWIDWFSKLESICEVWLRQFATVWVKLSFRLNYLE